jgi:hypothetical protein
VRIAREHVEIRAGGVHPSATGLEFTLDIPAGVAEGAWDLIATDVQGRETKLPGAARIAAKPAADTAQPGADASRPRFTEVLPNEVKRNATVPLTIKGNNLQAVSMIGLQRDPNTVIKAGSLQYVAGDIKCNVAIPPDVPTGDWSIVALSPENTVLSEPSPLTGRFKVI